MMLVRKNETRTYERAALLTTYFHACNTEAISSINSFFRSSINCMYLSIH